MKKPNMSIFTSLPAKTIMGLTLSIATIALVCGQPFFSEQDVNQYKKRDTMYVVGVSYFSNYNSIGVQTLLSDKHGKPFKAINNSLATPENTHLNNMFCLTPERGDTVIAEITSKGQNRIVDNLTQRRIFESHKNRQH